MGMKISSVENGMGMGLASRKWERRESKTDSRRPLFYTNMRTEWNSYWQFLFIKLLQLLSSVVSSCYQSTSKPKKKQIQLRAIHSY